MSIPYSTVAGSTENRAKRATRKITLLSNGFSEGEINDVLDHLDAIDRSYWETRKRLREDYMRSDQELFKAHAESLKQAMRKPAK